MKDTKNALAELAKEVQSIINALETDNFSTVGIGNLCKTQRIVAELAKVPNISQIPIKHWNCKELEALRNCLAIAEEGVKDGK